MKLILHPADVKKLLIQLNRLVDAGNTVILVEHDMDVIGRSDWVIDIGPGAGDEGGKIVAAGTPAEVAKVNGSKTAEYLARVNGIQAALLPKVGPDHELRKVGTDQGSA